MERNGMERKHYEVVVTHDPRTFQRLPEPKRFKWQTKEEALRQATLLIHDGLKRHQVVVYVHGE